MEGESYHSCMAQLWGGFLFFRQIFPSLPCRVHDFLAYIFFVLSSFIYDIFVLSSFIYDTYLFFFIFFFSFFFFGSAWAVST